MGRPHPPRRRRAAVLLLLAALLGVGSACGATVTRDAVSATTAAPAPRPAPRTVADVAGPDRPPAFGVQFHGTWDMYYTGSGSATPNALLGRHLDRLRDNHVALLRVDVGWSTSQPEARMPSPGHWYNRRVALVLDEAAARGLRVLLTVHQSPQWSRAETPATGVKRFPNDPTRITPWATWMARTFGDKVFAWEVWNEPNLSEFTGVADPKERARRYVPLLKTTSVALKAGDPDAVVVFGGPCQTDDAFIAEAYAQGAGPYFDVMAVHPYQGDQTRAPETADTGHRWNMTHFPAVVAVMERHGDGAKPVWWTEFGFSVHSNERVPANEKWRRGVPTAERSADYLRRSFELARTRYPQVRLAVVYTAYKTPSDPYGHQYGYRIIEPDGTPLPQLTTVGDYVASFDGSRPLL